MLYISAQKADLEIFVPARKWRVLQVDDIPLYPHAGAMNRIRLILIS